MSKLRAEGISRARLAIRITPSIGEAGSGADHIQAARAEDGTFLFVYSPTGKPVTIQLNKISGGRIKAHWFDPRTGNATATDDVLSLGTRKSDLPSQGRGNGLGSGARRCGEAFWDSGRDQEIILFSVEIRPHLLRLGRAEFYET